MVQWRDPFGLRDPLGEYSYRHFEVYVCEPVERLVRLDLVEIVAHSALQYLGNPR